MEIVKEFSKDTRLNSLKPHFPFLPTTGMTLARLKDGKIVSEHIYFDRLSLLEQLSVAPAGAAGSGSR
jgi:hypothetical protein